MKQLIAFIFLFTSITATSQTWSVELRPTLHIPTRDVLDRQLRIGNGIELTGVFSIGKHTDVYGGFIWNRFDTDEDFQELDIEFIQKGFLFGGMVFFKIKEDQRSQFYVRGGLSLMTVESESVEASHNINTDVAVGTHLGFGIKIISLGKWHILPELRYGYSSHKYQDAGVDNFLSFSHISITGAIRRRF